MATDFLGEQLQRMAVNWRLNLAPQDKVIQKREFKPLLDSWGEGKFKATVDRCIREHSTGFFPTIGEFERYETKPMGTVDLRTCPTCVNSEGWAYLQDGEGRTRVTRCSHGRPA